jgi:predicted GIY-YIG superfamily endonuclease
MACFRCGRFSHFAADCYAKTKVNSKRVHYDSDSDDYDIGRSMKCFRCGRVGHFADSCFAKTSANGLLLSSNSQGKSVPTAFTVRAGENPLKRQHSGRDAERSKYSKREGVYVLQASNGLQYVGKSNDIDSRICDHKQGDGAACLSGYGSLKEVSLMTTGSIHDLESWERSETLHRMKKYGISNVRGWMFTSSKLSKEETVDAFRQICEKFDLCRRCGRDTHFADSCFAVNVAVWAGGWKI